MGLGTHVKLAVAASVMLVMVTAGCDKLPGLRPKAGRDTTAAVEAPVVRGTVVAKVNNLPITLEELNQEVEAYNSMVPDDKQDAKLTTKEQKLGYLREQMVRALLLYQEAMDRRLDANEDISRILDKTKKELLVVELLRQETAGIEVTQQEIEESYNMYKDRFKEPEERQVREIVLGSEAEAKDVLIQLLQGTDFAALARERSRAASAKEGGSVGYVKPGDKFPQYSAAVFSETLDVGQVSSIFKGPDGWYLVKIENIRGGKEKPLSEAQEEIKRTLIFLKQQQKLEELIGKLSSGAKIEIYEGDVQ
jgi:parvulin-like peptidyl-prolyl isomerase